MFEKKFLILYLILLVVGIIIARQKSESSFRCTDYIECLCIAPSSPIKLGVIQAFTGSAAPFGIDQMRSIELAIAERDYQLLGHPIEIQKQDEQCLPEGGVNAALLLATQSDMVAVLGTTCSGAAVTASKIISDAGMVMVSGQNSAPSLTRTGKVKGENWHSGYFRTIHNGSAMGEAAAIFIFQHLRKRKTAIIDEGDPFTKEIANSFQEKFICLGGEVVVHIGVNRGDTEMHPALRAVALAGAESLFLSVYPPEGILLLSQLKEIKDLNNLILIGNGVLKEKNFIETVGQDGLGMYFVNSTPVKNPAVSSLVLKFKERYGESPKSSFYSYGYDAANLLLNAIEAATIKEEDGTLHIGRQALRDALYNTEYFKGITGILSCDEFGDCGDVSFDVVRLDDLSGGIESLESNLIYQYQPSSL